MGQRQAVAAQFAGPSGRSWRRLIEDIDGDGAGSNRACWATAKMAKRRYRVSAANSSSMRQTMSAMPISNVTKYLPYRTEDRINSEQARCIALTSWDTFIRCIMPDRHRAWRRIAQAPLLRQSAGGAASRPLQYAGNLPRRRRQQRANIGGAAYPSQYAQLSAGAYPGNLRKLTCRRAGARASTLQIALKLLRLFDDLEFRLVVSTSRPPSAIACRA